MADDLDRPDNVKDDDPTAEPWASMPLVPADPEITREHTAVPAGDGAATGDDAEAGGDDAEHDTAPGPEHVPETSLIEEIGSAPHPDDRENPAIAETSPDNDGPDITEEAAVTADRAKIRIGNLVEVLRDPTWRHDPKESFRFSLIVAAAVGLAYWFTNWPLPDVLGSHPSIDLYMVQPLVWGAVAALALHGWYRLEERPPASRMLIGIALLVGVFHVAVLVIAGVIWDFGDSPIAKHLVDYPRNLLHIGTLLAGLEFARAYLFQVWRRYGEQLAFGLVAAIFFAVVIPAAQWTPEGDFDNIATVVGGRWAPALALSILATFLVRYGGIGPSLAYRFALLGFEWLSPNLPDLEWPVLLVIGVLMPFASAPLVRNIYEKTTEGARRVEAGTEVEVEAEAEPHSYLGNAVMKGTPQKPSRHWVGWAVTGGFVLLLVLFFTGALGFRMVVIEGTSMESAYERGDLAIVREGIDANLLRIDDVIVFTHGGRRIVHRIVAIEETEDGLVFTTRGDNVTRPDPQIRPWQIEGKVVLRIPDVGHINLWFRGG